jgi:hypothetical protein
MHSLYLLLLKDITRKKRRYQQRDKYEERPRGEELLLLCIVGAYNRKLGGSSNWGRGIRSKDSVPSGSASSSVPDALPARELALIYYFRLRDIRVSCCSCWGYIRNIWENISFPMRDDAMLYGLSKPEMKHEL